MKADSMSIQWWFGDMVMIQWRRGDDMVMVWCGCWYGIGTMSLCSCTDDMMMIFWLYDDDTMPKRWWYNYSRHDAMPIRIGYSTGAMMIRRWSDAYIMIIRCWHDDNALCRKRTYFISIFLVFFHTLYGHMTRKAHSHAPSPRKFALSC